MKTTEHTCLDCLRLYKLHTMYMIRLAYNGYTLCIASLDVSTL